ncbi:hypothetical protein [Amedibacillus sp. YH-ame10]
MELIYESKSNYDKKIKIRGSSCPFYSKKAMKKIHPQGDFIIAGSVGKGLKKKIGELHYRNKTIDYYANNYSRVRFKLRGYIAVNENRYIEVVQPKGIQRLILLLSILLLLLIPLIYVLQGSDIDPSAKNYVPSNGEEIKTDPDHIALPSYEKLIMKAGTDTAYVALYNPSQNPCYFKFTIYLRDSEAKIFESKMIPPGQAVTEIKFDKNFNEGVYPISIKIDAFSLEKKEVLNGGLIESRIVAME